MRECITDEMGWDEYSKDWMKNDSPCPGQVKGGLN